MKTKDKPKTTEPNDMPAAAYHWVWRVAYAAALAATPNRPMSGAAVSRMANAIWREWKKCHPGAAQ